MILSLTNYYYNNLYFSIASCRTELTVDYCTKAISVQGLLAFFPAHRILSY